MARRPRFACRIQNPDHVASWTAYFIHTHTHQIRSGALLAKYSFGMFIQRGLEGHSKVMQFKGHSLTHTHSRTHTRARARTFFALSIRQQRTRKVPQQSADEISSAARGRTLIHTSTDTHTGARFILYVRTNNVRLNVPVRCADPPIYSDRRVYGPVDVEQKITPCP